MGGEEMSVMGRKGGGGGGWVGGGDRTLYLAPATFIATGISQ